jgi:hypothetical protein
MCKTKKIKYSCGHEGRKLGPVPCKEKKENDKFKKDNPQLMTLYSVQTRMRSNEDECEKEKKRKETVPYPKDEKCGKCTWKDKAKKS